jgi:prolyl-tRNA synthetase
VPRSARLLRLLAHIALTVSPLALTESTVPRVTTVLDASLASSSDVFAVRAGSSAETLFLKGTEIAAYLRHLEKGEAKLHELDFAALAADGGAPAVGDKSAPKERAKKEDRQPEDAKIEGAVQIAIGVKKDVDFPAWSTNVRTLHYGSPGPHTDIWHRSCSRPT